MRQSHKETHMQRMMRAGLMPERREAMVFPEQTHTEFAAELSPGSIGGSRNGRRHNPGGRG